MLLFMYDYTVGANNPYLIDRMGDNHVVCIIFPLSVFSPLRAYPK